MSAPTVDGLLAAAEPTAPRPLHELAHRLAAPGLLASATGLPDVAIGGGIVHDSRRARPGCVFVAIAGSHADGHDHVAEAVASGAAAVIVERQVSVPDAVQLVVSDTRRALAEAACWWYGDPSLELPVVGITGTDGKTTTSCLAVAALEAAGLQSGLIGTIETRIGGIARPDTEHQTTPEAPELQAALRAMLLAGDSAAIVETTSHGLALARVAGIAYQAAVFTNLSHEHLELHGSYEAYREAKLSLFRGLERRIAARAVPTGIVNLDDPEAARFLKATRSAGASPVTYGVAEAADVRGADIAETSEGVRFSVTSAGWSRSVGLRMRGRFNVHNALAVIALGTAWDLDIEAVVAGIESVPRVPGRMERIDAGQPFEVIVDFAHSPASLEAVLDELGPRAAAEGGGVIAVFGSAGERDTAKRPLMGRVAAKRCRLVIVTDEDPRDEDGDAILDEIAAGAEATGMERGRDLHLVRDRRAAIAHAFDEARPMDVVLLAGKGHERSIIGPDGPQPWDEAAIARELLRARGWDRAG